MTLFTKIKLRDSILGPLLWNVMNNGLVMLSIIGKATIVSFANNLIVVVTVRHLEHVEVYVTKMVRAATI